MGGNGVSEEKDDADWFGYRAPIPSTTGQRLSNAPLYTTINGLVRMSLLALDVIHRGFLRGNSASATLDVAAYVEFDGGIVLPTVSAERSHGISRRAAI